MDLGPNFGIPADPAANEYRLRHVGRISYPVFQGTVITLFTISVLAVIASTGIRIHTRHQLRVDDYFMLFGVLCLCGTTGLLLNIARDLFVAEAAGRDLAVKLTLGDIQSSADSLTRYLSFRSLAWTTIVCVKFSFLALFRLLIRHLSKRIVIYFWFVVGCTLLAWLYLVTVDWLICRHTGTGPVICVRPSVVGLLRQMCITSNTIDIMTDIMIISIPIFTLGKYLMHPMQKIDVLVFLCLSIVMIVITIIRISDFKPSSPTGPILVDFTWLCFWLYLEACTAIIMGSMTAFRSLFAQRVPRPFPANIAHKQIPSKRYSQNRGRLGMAKPDGKPGTIPPYSRIYGGEWKDVCHAEEFLPNAPQKTHIGIKTYIYHNDGVNSDAPEIFLESGRGRGLQPIAECKAESD